MISKKYQLEACCPAEDQPDLIYAIGQITCRHAMLETLVRDLISFLLNLPRKQGIALSTNLGMKSKLEITGSLMHEIDMHPAKRKFIETTLKEASAATDKRNKITHRLIGYGVDKEEGLQMSHQVARGKEVKETSAPISVAEVHTLSVELGIVNMKLIRALIGDEPWEEMPGNP